MNGISHPHDNALVVISDIADFDVRNVLVDEGNATNILTWDTFLSLKIFLQKLKMMTTALHGFGWVMMILEGTVEFSIKLSMYPTTMVIMTNFLVVKILVTYNAIYDRPLLNATFAIPSTYRWVMKLSTTNGVGEYEGIKIHK